MVMEAELADGTVLEFPDGTDPAVIQQTVKKTLSLQNGRNAGAGTPSVEPQSAQDMANQGIGPFESGLIAAGRGMTDIGRAVGLVDPEPPAATAAFEQLEERHPISTTVGEIAGQAAPFLAPGVGVANIAALPLRAGATAALGALEGGLISKAEGATTNEQLQSATLGGIVAGGIELALPRIARIGRQIWRRVTGKEPTKAIIDKAGNPTDEFIDALKKDGKTYDDVVKQVDEELTDELVDPSQVARKAFLESQGIDPTKAQVSRTADDFQLQQEAAKTSGRVREAIEAQDAALTTRFDNKVLETGGQAVTPTSSVTDALVSKATVLDQEINDLYGLARELAPGDKNVKFDRLTAQLRKLAPSNRRAGGNIEAIVGDMQSKGILDKSMNVVGKVDVETAEDLRKLTNELFDAANPFGNMLLRRLKDSLDDDVFKAAGDDVFKQARQSKAKFESDLARAKISKFDSRKANLVRDVLENKIDPDQLTDKVVFGKAWRADDLQQLKDYITTKDIDGLPFGDEAGEAAFNDLRAETLHAIKTRSFIGPEDASGVRALSRDKLEKSLKAIGPKKLDILFTPEENQFLNDMLKVSKLREPVRGTQQGKGPSAQAIVKIEQFLKKVPLFGSLVDFIDIDAAGRIAIKATPQRSTIGFQPSLAKQAGAQTGAIGGVLATQEEQR